MQPRTLFEPLGTRPTRIVATPPAIQVASTATATETAGAGSRRFRCTSTTTAPTTIAAANGVA